MPIRRCSESFVATKKSAAFSRCELRSCAISCPITKSYNRIPVIEPPRDRGLMTIKNVVLFFSIKM